jgi:hypothetical protein
VLSVQGALQVERRQDCTSGVVFMRNRGAKQRHEAISKELINGTFIAVHGVESQLEEATEQSMHVVWAAARRHGGGVGQVTEEHRDLLALSLQGATER